MKEESRYIKESFLSPIRKYYGEFTLGSLIFNANLQEFQQQVSYICNLAANEEISAEDAYEEINKFWRQLKQSKKEFLDKEKLNPN